MKSGKIEERMQIDRKLTLKLIKNYAHLEEYQMGQSIQEWTSKICERQLLKIWSDVVCLNRPYHFRFFKGCLSQNILGAFLNTLSQIVYHRVDGEYIWKHLLLL